MPQASLLTWLSKPAAVTEAPVSHSSTTNKPAFLARGPETPPLDTRQSIQQDGTALDDKTSDTQQRSSVHPNVSFRPCTKADVPAFKAINALLLPIPYAESFYREILSDPVTNNLTILAFWHDNPRSSGRNDCNSSDGKLVGAVRCRLLAQDPPSTPVSSSPVSATATSSGGPAPQQQQQHTEQQQQQQQHKKTKKGPMLYLSTLVLLSPYRGHGIASAMVDELTRRAVRAHGIVSVGAHVWEANHEGLEWYSKRGFNVEGRVEKYYPRLKPQAAVVVSREVKLSDVLGVGAMAGESG